MSEQFKQYIDPKTAIQHRTWLLRHDGRLHHAPIEPSTKNTFRVLDAGCGSGIWAVEFGIKHPNAEILGVDITPPELESAPPNCKFEKADLEGEWTFAGEQKYDLIMARLLGWWVKDWLSFLEKCKQHLVQGGWLELFHGGHPLGADNPRANVCNSAFLLNGALQEDALARSGIDPRACDRHADRLKILGFSTVSEYEYKAFIGDWPDGERDKLIGRNEKHNWQDVMGRQNPILLKGPLRMEDDEAERVTLDMLKDVEENSVSMKYYYRQKVVIAQIPP